MVVIFILFTLFALAAALVVFLLDVLLTGKTPLVVTPRKSRRKIIDILKLTESSVFYDLGCGTSRLLVECSKVYPSAKFIGIDNALFSYIFSKVTVGLRKPRNISIKFGSFFNFDLSSATHVYLWIFVKDMDNLLEKFDLELQLGASVYALDFPFSKKQPEQVVDLGRNNKFGHTLYIYKF